MTECVELFSCLYICRREHVEYCTDAPLPVSETLSLRVLRIGLHLVRMLIAEAKGGKLREAYSQEKTNMLLLTLLH